MNFPKYRITANWGHIVFVTFIVAVCLSYLYDVLSVSLHIHNTILVVPSVGAVLLLYVWVVLSDVRVRRLDANSDKDEISTAAGEDRTALTKSMVLMVAVGVYAFGYEHLGLDLASFVFMVVVLFLLGERRPIFVVGYAAIFTFIVVGGAHALLPFPMPMVLL